MLPHLLILEIEQESTCTTNLCFSRKANQILLAEGRITGDLKHTLFHPELQWWTTVLILSGRIPLVFWHRFACLDWDSIHCRMLQNTVADKRMPPACTWSLPRLYQNFEIVLHPFEIASPFWNRLAITQFPICAAQFRNHVNFQIVQNILQVHWILELRVWGVNCASYPLHMLSQVSPRLHDISFLLGMEMGGEGVYWWPIDNHLSFYYYRIESILHVWHASLYHIMVTLISMVMEKKMDRAEDVWGKTAACFVQ